MTLQISIRPWDPCHQSVLFYVPVQLARFMNQRKKTEAEIIGGANDDTLLLKATKQFHKYLLGDPIKEIIPEVVDRLLEFLNRDDYPELQFEAALAIEGISKCSSDNINMLIDHGAIPILLSLLRSPEDDLREQVKTVILPLTRLIYTDDEIVCLHACMALCYLTCESKDKIQAVIDAGVFPRLVDLFLSPSQFVLHPALTAVYYIIAYVDVIQIQLGYMGERDGRRIIFRFLVREGCIKSLCDLLASPNEAGIIKFCLEGLENILKGGEAEKNQCNTDDVNVFAQMIDDAGGIQKIKDLQTDHDDRQIRVIAMRTVKKYWPEEATKSKFSMNCKIL
ncbi:unnamed protein product [Fraxinus pennsylvanica]|uniref:Uncharacterized protein n=1 Tax=Fraxinus pennsylvanica TaxID=56036 RepID=A0AAD2E878_9LAMI|nr:unnamed protein product [Fraxinus pennsylvanica]